jgi:hypothetical protein
VDAREDGSPPRDAAGCLCAGMTLEPIAENAPPRYLAGRPVVP